MATYKVLQDIEAEDKFVGPLTLKQFIFAGITFVCLYLSFFFLSKGAWLLVLPLVPIILSTGFLAWPWGRDQPTEIWLLAKIRFMLKPRRRIWDQTGIEELVKITAPKLEDNVSFDNLSQTEVKSRLKALAETIDSRGWAVKNVNVNMFSQPTSMTASEQSDRLVSLSDFTREVPSLDVGAADDILDEHNNPTAQHLSQMIGDSTKAHKQATLDSLDNVREHKVSKSGKKAKDLVPAPDNWFMNLPQAQTTQQSISHAKKGGIGTKTKRAGHGAANRDETTSGKRPNPAILELAGNDDLTVATIARQAGKKPGQQPPSDEIVVSLR